MRARTEPATSGKGLIRSLDRRGTRSNQKPPVALKTPEPFDPTVCQRCGAVYSQETWRRNHPLTGRLLERAQWGTCPGCTQAAGGEYHGRVLARGATVAAKLDAIRRRIHNVAQRAGFTQPERQIVSIEWDGTTLEILTTSQKLAHRIAHELAKAFGGRAKYQWGRADGEAGLLATWQSEARAK